MREIEFDLLDEYSSILEEKNIFHNSFVNIFFELYQNYLESLEKLLNNFSLVQSREIKLILSDELFKKSLTLMIIPDQSWEELFTNLRKEICLKFSEGYNFPDELLSFLKSLSIQCFLTDYVYEVTQEELDIVKSLIREKNIKNLSIISCYFPLYTIQDISDYIPQNNDDKFLLELQVKEPLEELEISKTIEKIGDIKNKISEKVKDQYMQNPYPRWRYTYYTDPKFSISIDFDINSSISPICRNSNLSKINKPKILIAGCGTGQQVIHTSMYKDAEITAIDLSEKSISYAKRKAKEYGMDNVRFVVMDILNIDMLNQKFDVIECGGVLHHMENPSEALSILCRSLSSTGYIKLGLYSKLARTDVIKSHEEIKLQKIESTPEGIRKFRKQVFSEELKDLQSLKTKFIDFYGLSTCRDLCFHVCEHQYTISDIASLLEKNNLEFCGFNLPPFLQEKYLKSFPEDEMMINLNNWDTFEHNNPNTFLHMYQFFVRFKLDKN